MGDPVKPPVHYYGAKVRLAPWIVEHMPAHEAYIEPFFGSGAVLFSKPPSRFEVANDLDDLVVNFFRVLREQTDELVHALELTPYSRSEHEAADPAAPGLSDLERARRWWIRCVQGFGRMPEKAGWSTSIAGGATQAASAQALVARIPACARRLQRVLWESRPAVEVIGRYDRPSSLFYVDPPYAGATRAGLAKRPKDYRMDMPSDEDHRELATVLAACKGTVIVSGYPSGLYDELFSGWYTLERQVVKHSARIGGGGPAPWATEVLWSNRPFGGRLPFDASPAVEVAG